MIYRESKRIFKSLIFLILSVTLAIAIIPQAMESNEEVDVEDNTNELESVLISAPKPGQERYGHFIADDLSLFYEDLVLSLKRDLEVNHFTTYPYGFYRVKKLDNEELEAIKDILSDLTSTPFEDIAPGQDFSIPDREKLELRLAQIDALLGGGSLYGPKMYRHFFADLGMTYEEALADYKVMEKKGLDVAFARYFSDYAGVFTLLLTWFMGLFFWLKDQRAGIAPILYTKRVTSFRFVCQRIILMSLALMLSLWLIFSFFEWRLLRENSLEVLRPLSAYGLVFLWIFPIIFFVNSISSCLYLFTRSVLICLLGPLFSLVYFQTGTSSLYFNIGYRLVIRYNHIGNEIYFHENWPLFLRSRILWIVLSLPVIILAAYLYERRRCGYVVKSMRNSSSKRA